MGRYSESLYLERNILLPLSRYYNQKNRTDFILLQQSANLFDLGKFFDAKEILEGLYNDPSSTIPNSQLYNNLSLCYQQLGKKHEYTSFLLKAIQDVEKDSSKTQDIYKIKLGLYKNLFVYYNYIGDSTSALPFIKKAQNLAQNNNDQYELGTIHYYLGEYYLESFKNYKKALTEFELASLKFKDLQNYRSRKLLLNDEISVLIKMDSLKRAMASIKEIKEIASKNSDTPQFIEALIFEAEIASSKNNLIELESILNEIKIYSLEDLEFEVLVRYHNIYAEYLHKQGKNRAAYAYYKPKLDQIISRAQGSVDAETGFWTVAEEYLDAFEIMISILRELGNDKESITYLDKLKTINDASLYNNILLKAAKLTEQELTEEKKLTTEIQSLRSRYLSADEDMKSALKTEIDKLSAQKQLLVNKVSQSKNKEEIIPVWMIQQQISTKELVLHFTELNDQLYVSRITKNSASITGLDLTPEISRLLNSSANGLAVGQTSLTSLYDIFEFLRLDEIPDDVAQITVIPDNELYRLPLDILPTKPPNSSSSFGSTRYMIEDYSFKYFTSLQDYAKNNRNYSSSLSNDFSAFAISYFDDFTEKPLPSLPYATQEVREIKNVLTEFEKKKVFAGNTATEQAFQEQLATSRILHVATHSEVSVQDPLFSTIYLKSSKSNGNRGDALYAYELFDNQLKNELIMLNSCSSGNGNYLQGTGIMGISRALRFAGSKSLALNLWEVNDKIASEFATSFYSYMNKGLSKSAAMRLAKIDQLKTGSADPHYWGAYTLIGNPSPIIKKPSKSEILLPLMIVVGLLIGYKVRI
ncbi:MAG: CHAT domain-containing protein, partial [Balneola sp.]